MAQKLIFDQVFNALGDSEVFSRLPEERDLLKWFGLQAVVVGTPLGDPEFAILLECSLIMDAPRWTALLTVNQDNVDQVQWNPQPAPCTFFRLRCSHYELNGAEGVLAAVVGT